VTERVNLDNLTIPIVDLDRYRFSPPGSMGWSEAEYEQLITDPERTIQTDTFSPPKVPQTEWTELSASKDRADGSLPATEKMVIETVGTEIPVKEASDLEKAETTPINEEQKNDYSRSDYIPSPNPPARPWLAPLARPEG
jgi:hypothetical protein